MTQARCWLYCAHLACRSAISTLPYASVAVTDDFETRHLGAGGDEAHVALALTARLLPCRSGLQSSWLAGLYASAGAGRRIHQIHRIILIFS